jgi:hypothetical protein
MNMGYCERLLEFSREQLGSLLASETEQLVNNSSIDAVLTDGGTLPRVPGLEDDQ